MTEVTRMRRLIFNTETNGNAETDGDAKAYLNPETINRKERDMRRVFGLGFWKWRSDNIWQWRNV